jgi:hypothetical protein
LPKSAPSVAFFAARDFMMSARPILKAEKPVALRPDEFPAG